MPRPAPQVERLISVVDLLAADPYRGRSLAELARHLGVDKATCIPMLHELISAGWLIRQSARKEYRLGPALIEIGRAATKTVDAVEIARPHLSELANALELPIAAVVPTADGLVLAELLQPLAGRRGTHSLRIGDWFHLGPPLGAVFVAWADDVDVENWIARRDGEPNEALNALYRSALAQIRERGFAVEHDRPEPIAAPGTGSAGEIRRHRRLSAELRAHLTDDVLVDVLDSERAYRPFSINAPVFDLDGAAVLAVVALLDPPITRTGSMIRDVGEEVRATAERVTAIMGGNVPS